MRRRALLRTLPAAATGLAGCLGGNRGDGSGDGGGAAGTPMAEHPAADGLAAQPFDGPGPAEATAVIVAFEDPSCPRCRRFEQETVPKLRENLVDPGHAAFVFRGFPVVYEWGKPAAQALESTYARDEAAFWSLAAFYFDQQPSLGTDNVLEQTESFLADVDVDAAAVVGDAREKAHDDAVQVDLDAGNGAGYSATPSVALFEDGAFVTTVTGAQSYDVYANALDVP